MISFIAQAQSTAEEAKMFLEAKSLEEIKKKLNELYMILLFRV